MDTNKTLDQAKAAAENKGANPHGNPEEMYKGDMSEMTQHSRAREEELKEAAK